MAVDTIPQTGDLQHAGPHPWQIQPWAKLVRRLWRRRAYTRWVDRYCTELTVTGREHVEAMNGPCIFIANHQSHMDTLVLFQAMPERTRRRLFFGAAQDRWYVKGRRKLVLQPWYQSLVLGNFPIRRGGGSAALDHARWLLSRGQQVCIFPEGTRATGEALGRFRAGVALLALEQDVPVVPVYLSGLKEMRPKGQREVTPGPAAVDILEPVRFASGTRVADATALLWERLSACHRQRYPERPPELDRAA
ncbi:MAG: lysophospholipid acyltransferase family protein [Pseudomonadales bacterium]